MKKCPYCDFNSHPLRGEPQYEAYADALLQEFRAKTSALESDAVRRFDTLFFGGGTPSLLPARILAKLIDAFRPYLRDDAEVTVEANPGATERGNLAALRAAGVNRLSIGAQSFSPTSLNRLGRIHRPDETRACLEAARQGGFENINLDIMYGLPGQSANEALSDLAQAIALAPDHLSWYQLTIEPKTEFAQRPPKNLPGEEAIFAMENAGRELLHRAGFARYEVSAYAKPGAVCRHNLVYWTFGDYLGLGAGAHGKLSAIAAEVLFPNAAKSRKTRLATTRQQALAAIQPGGHEHKQVQTLMDSRSPPRMRRTDIQGTAYIHASEPRRSLIQPDRCEHLSYHAHILRTHNPRSPRLYLKNPCDTQMTLVSPVEIPGEFMMGALRLVGGVDRGLFEQRTGLTWRIVEPTWRQAVRLGLAESGRIATTPKGLQHLDSLLQYFL